MMTRPVVFFIVAIAAIVAAAPDAAAQVVDGGVFDSVMAAFKSSVSGWADKVKTHAKNLFWTLTLISLVWTGGTMALKRADPGEILGEFSRFVMTTGFFFWLLDNGPAIALSIVESMQAIGTQAVGGTGSFTPQAFFDQALRNAGEQFKQASAFTPVDSAVMILLSVALVFLFAWVAIQMVLAIVVCWVIAFAGVFFLGFGGGRWTSDIAVNYYKTVLQLAVQVMAFVLVAGVGNDIITRYWNSLGSVVSFDGILVLVIVAYVYAMLLDRVPAALSSVVAGGSVGAAGAMQSLGAALMTAAGAMTAAASAMTLLQSSVEAGTSLAGGAMSSAAGAAGAVREAFGSAMQDRAAGRGLF
jgi:type IV secretion system protein TrbL